MKLSYKIFILLYAFQLVEIIWVVAFLVPNTDYILSHNGFNIPVHFQVYLKILTIFLLAVVPAITILYLFIHKVIVHPITNLESVTKLIAQGNLGKRVDIIPNDEIGNLSKNINLIIKNLVTAYQSMSDSLRDTIHKSRELSSNLEVLRESKAHDEALLTSIGEGVIAIDISGKISFTNNSALTLLGWDSHDLTNQNWTAYLASANYPISKTLSTGLKSQQTCYFTRKDGSVFPAAVNLSPILINNAITGCILVFRDITLEKEIDRMKTEFISLASHQLRTPLSAIRWFTELLLDGTTGNLTGDQKELANNINLSTLRMIELVNSLLNISRIESGRIIVDPKPTDLADLVKEILTELQEKIKDKEINLVVSMHEKLPTINIDPKLIRQVYMNLLTNAIKYTPKGGQIVIFISKKGEEIISQVSDNGYGIPKSEFGKVFNKFYRGENIIKVETDGNGLGLYLVKSIIDSSEGKIWFDSIEGKGTTFWFSLPISGMKAKKGEVTLDG
jgi:PAS domain S-box-containing protein